MKTKLQELVEALAIRRRFCLGRDDYELALLLPGQEHYLVIEAMNEVIVKVGYRVEGEHTQGLNAYAVVFYTRDSEWVIVEAETLEFSFIGATLENNESGFYCASIFPQEEVIQAIAQWTERPSAQEWLENGMTIYPSDELAPPSFSDLAAWMEEGGCEALDGCWVEPDGHCEHGSPSWLLHYGMI